MNRIIIALLAALVSMVAAQSFAADAESEAGAIIVSPIQIANISSLYFGTVAPSMTAADMVTVGANGAKVCGPELTCLTEDHTAARFSVSGAPNLTYTVSMPSSTEISNGEGDSMTVNGFSGPGLTGTLDAAGASAFSLGGTLNIDANQASGSYMGTFTVSVEYQ